MPRFLVAFLAVAAARAAGAQCGCTDSTIHLGAIAAGTEIRMWSQQPPLKGWKLRYLGLTDTSLVVAERKGSAPAAGFHSEIPFSAIDSVEIARGKRFDARHAGNSVLAGTALGAAIGVVAGAMSGAGEDGRGIDAIAAIGLGTLGALGGGLVGGIVGSQGTTVWARIPIR